MFRQKHHVVIHHKPISPKSLPFYQEYHFSVPYIFSPVKIKPSPPRENPTLVGCIKGEGLIQAIVFHTNYFGITMGYAVNGEKINWINNGLCLKKWGADRLNAQSMPVFLVEYKNRYNLSIAVNTPIAFRDSFKLYFHNRDKRKTRSIDSLHLYMYGKNIHPGEGNLLRDLQ